MAKSVTSYWSWGGQDISAHVTDGRFPREFDEQETTGVGATAATYQVGIERSGIIEISGTWDNTATTGFVAAIAGTEGTAIQIIHGPNGSTIGQQRFTTAAAGAVVLSVESRHTAAGLVLYSARARITGAVTIDTFV